MSFDWLENFEYFGLDPAKMLNGLWSAYTGPVTIEVPAWETLGRPWLRMLSNGGPIARRVVSAGGRASSGIGVQIYLENLPSSANACRPITFTDAGNVTVLSLRVNSVGALQVYNASNVLVATSTGAVFNAATITTLQLQVVMHATAGTLEIRKDKVAIPGLTALTNLAIPGTICNYVAEFQTALDGSMWIKHVAPYSLSGTYNSSWPSFTRVALNLPTADDPAHKAWTPRPRQIFGVGVAYVPGALGTFSNSGIQVGPSAALDLGSGDFTVEGCVRFTRLPTGTDEHNLMGKWSSTGNFRSYRLVKYGPSLNSGALRWEISTDGTAAGIVVVQSLTWAPVVGHVYQVAISRTAGVTRVFVDGVALGVGVADANTYFAAGVNTVAAVGCEPVNTAGTNVTGASAFAIYDEVRWTVGVGRYTTNYSPAVAQFPRTIGGDPSFASVQLLLGFDSLPVVDESTTPKTISFKDLAVRLTPGDGGGLLYPTLGTATPFDDRFLEAALLPASNILNVTANFANGDTVTLGAKVYTFNTVLGGANSILIGGSVNASLVNLDAAIRQAAGSGTIYGVGTTANATITSAVGPSTTQLTATAITPGTAGNALASTETAANAAFLSGATLAGGTNIPAYSAFNFAPPPPEATGVRAVFLLDRSYLEADTASVQKGFEVSGVNANGANNALNTSATYRGDVIEEDPSTVAALTISSILNGKFRINRTA